MRDVNERLDFMKGQLVEAAEDREHLRTQVHAVSFSHKALQCVT